MGNHLHSQDDLKDNQTNVAMQGAVILTLAAVVAKILSAIYRVPLQNMVGNTGFYVYQQVYPIYGIGMTFALNGLPSFIGKQVAIQETGQQQRNLIKKYAVIVSIFAAVCFVGIYFAADQIAYLMGDALLASPIQSVSFMFLLMPVLLISRGYLQGQNYMLPTAISQVVEQFTRVAVILTVAFLYTRLSATGQATNVYQLGFWLMQSAWIAAAIASLVMVYYSLRFRGKAMYQDFLEGHYGIGHKAPPSETIDTSWSQLIRSFVTEGFVICFFAALLVFYQLVDAFTVYGQLVDNGIVADVAKEMKGIYDRGQPIVQLGMVVATSLATSFLPILARVKKDQPGQSDQFEQISNQYLRVTLVFAILITGGLISIMPQLNHFLFASRSGSNVLMVYLLMVIMASLVLGQNNILQAQNRWYIAGIAFVIGISIKLVLTGLLVRYFDTMGAAWATNIGLLSMAIFLERFLPGQVGFTAWRPVVVKGLGLATLMVVLNIALAHIWHNLLAMAPTRGLDSLLMCVQIAVGVCLVWLFLKKDAILAKNEWLSLPKGELIWGLIQGK